MQEQISDGAPDTETSEPAPTETAAPAERTDTTGRAVTALLLSPHNDDAVLFASWLCLRFNPHVVTVLRSVNQEANGITAAEREAEDRAAMAILGCSWEQLPFPDNESPWDDVRESLEHMRDLEWAGDGSHAERRIYQGDVFAPYPQPHGHGQHDQVGWIAREVFGERVTYYATYRYGGPRTVGTPSEPEPWMIPLKLRALACYESQMLRGPRRFFMHGLDEWTMP